MKKLTNLIEATRNEHMKESDNSMLLSELKEKGCITNVNYTAFGHKRIIVDGILVKPNYTL